MNSSGILALALLGGLGGCWRPDIPGGGPGQVLPGGALESEAWVRRVPMELDSEFGETARVESCVVSEEKEAEAVRRLESSAWCVLTRAEAERFVGREMVMAEGKGVFVLLRCVQRWVESARDGREDSTRVLWSSERVVVRSVGLRDDYTSLMRKAVVAVLPSEPREVFVDVLTAIR